MIYDLRLSEDGRAMPAARVLIYTVALDREGETGHREMAKILVSSLLRTYFTGEILVVHNGDGPLFRVEQKGVKEVVVTMPAAEGYALKYLARDLIEPSRYDWVCFLDCDMIALRNVDHLFDPGEKVDILWQPEPSGMATIGYNAYFQPEEYGRLWRQGANSGSFAVRGEHYRKVMRQWQEIDITDPVSTKATYDQPAWNRLLFDTTLRRRPFERDEIQFPILFHHRYLEWRSAALLHANGVRDNKLKLEFLMAQYLGRFLGEPPGPILSMLVP